MESGPQQFLQWLRPGGPWVLVAIPWDKEKHPEDALSPPTRTFSTLDDIDDWLGSFEGGDFNFYVQVNPTKGPMAKKPGRKDIAALEFLHVDVDPPKTGIPDDEDARRAWYDQERERIRASLTDNLPDGIPEPSGIIDSGGGYWGFWRLDEAMAIGGQEELYEQAKLFNLKLELEFGADSCHNVDRLCRLPGTTNYPDGSKRARGRVETVAKVVKLRGHAYPLDRFEKAPDVRGSSGSNHEVKIDAASVKRIRSLDELPRSVNDFCKVVIAQGHDPDDPTRWGSRSEAVLYVCCELLRNDVPDETIYAIITDPDWGISASVVERDHDYAVRQIERAREKEDLEAPVLSPSHPSKSARIFRRRERPNLMWHNGDWLDYDGRAYRFVEDEEIQRDVWAFLESARVKEKKGFGPFIVSTPAVVSAVEAALLGIALRTQQHEPPCWIEGDGADPDELIVCANGILHLPTGELLPHTPGLFTMNALEVPYDPQAPTPERWYRFLAELWPDDPASLETLQEVFGYLLVPDTSLHKMFLIEGPPRSGKGTIAQVLQCLVGKDNYCAPGLSSLGSNFGLQPLVGKQLAVISDARIGKRSDIGVVVENLLRISGGDAITADRKNKTHWTGFLSVRFLMLSNGLPQFIDSSGALGNRFVPLRLTNSYLGKEDPRMADELMKELPGILTWAVEGWRRLRERGHFVPPPSGQEMIADLIRSGSPVRRFVEESCEREEFVCKKELYQAYLHWCGETGEKSVSDNIFGKDILALGGIEAAKVAIKGNRTPVYRGLRLAVEDEAF